MRRIRSFRVPDTKSDLRPRGGRRQKKRGATWLAWARRVAIASIGLVAIALGLVLFALHSLERPWIKGHVIDLARSSANLEVDYQSARIEPLSGATFEGLVVRSPAAFRAFAPDVVRIGHLEAHWSLASLTHSASTPLLERVVISDVAVTVVQDEHGTTSFDLLFPPDPHAKPSAPSSPLSHRAADLLAQAPPVGKLDVTRVSATLLQTQDAHVSQRMDLGGVALSLVASPRTGGRGEWALHTNLGTVDAPLDLVVSRAVGDAPASTGNARVWIALDATSAAMTAAVDVQMDKQTFAPTLSAAHWVHAEALASFDAAHGTTEVTLSHTAAADGAATVDAAIELPDNGDPTVQHAEGDLDLAKVLAWLPPGLAPVTADGARIHYRVEKLTTGSFVHLDRDGSATIDAKLSNVTVANGSDANRVHVADAALSVHASAVAGPANTKDGIAGKATLSLGATRVGSMAIDGLSADLDGTENAAGTMAGHAGVRFARFEARGASPVDVHDGNVDLDIHDLALDGKTPLETKGDVTMSVTLAKVEAAGKRVTADGLGLHAHTALTGHAPYAGEIDAPVARLRVVGTDGHSITDGPAHFVANAHDFAPDADHPVASLGAAHADVTLGDVHATLDAQKLADAVDFAIDAAAPTLRKLRAFVPAALLQGVPLETMALSLRSKGRIASLSGAAPSLRQTTQIELTNPGYGATHAKSVSLQLASEGTAMQQKADLDLRTDGLAVDGGVAANDHLTMSVSIDRAKPAVQIAIATEGRASTKGSASFSFDAARHAVDCAITGHLGELAALAPFAAKIPALAPIDLTQLAIDGDATGAVYGVIDGVTSAGAMSFAADPLRTLAVEGNANLKVGHVHWSKGDTAIVAPDLAWNATMHRDGARRVLESHVNVSAVHLDLGIHDVDLNGIDDHATVSAQGELGNPEITVQQDLRIRAIEQTLVPEYPLGDLSLFVNAERSVEGIVHVTDVKMNNGKGGTSLALNGNVDLGEGRRTVSLSTTLTQALGKLSTIPDRFVGQGDMAVEANVTSPDFVHFRVKSVVKGDRVSFRLPRAGVEVENANGEVPVTVQIEAGEHGVALERTLARAGFSMLRFADQHPLLARSGVLSISKIVTPYVTIAPLVGNLEIDQNVISLRQFEMGVRGGTITGLCGVDWDGAKSTVELHVRASGVQSSHGEPFDGNLAIALSAADHTIDGRAEILRIGKRHLLDLLDLEDPLHVDAGMNRIRTALVFGYPDSLRLVFDHGFANAHLELGGIARLISIGDLRGIPMGPIVDKMMNQAADANQANASHESP